MLTLTMTEKNKLKLVTGRAASGKTLFVQKSIGNTPTIVVTQLENEWASLPATKHILHYDKNVESTISSILTWLKLPNEDWNKSQIVVLDEFILQHASSRRLFDFCKYLTNELEITVYIISQQDLTELL